MRALLRRRCVPRDADSSKNSISASFFACDGYESQILLRLFSAQRVQSTAWASSAQAIPRCSWRIAWGASHTKSCTTLRARHTTSLEERSSLACCSTSTTFQSLIVSLRSSRAKWGGKLASEDACVGVRINPLLGSRFYRSALSFERTI